MALPSPPAAPLRARLVCGAIACALAPVYAHHVAHTGPNDVHASDKVRVNGKLREVIGGLRERNIELHVARAALELRLHLEAVGLAETIGADHVHSTVTAAVDASTTRS